MKDISEITIQLNEQNEKVSLFKPFRKKISEEKKNVRPIISLSTHAQAFIFKHLPFLTPKWRCSAETRLKTVIASLLKEKRARCYLLDDKERKKKFFKSIKQICVEMSIPLPRCSDEASLTTLAQGTCLLKNREELYLLRTLITKHEYDALLYELLSQVGREPIHSTLEVIHSSGSDKISIMTKYMKFKIFGIQECGKILYDAAEDQTTSSIRTKQNILPGEKGAVNQRIVYNDKKPIGFYAGELSSKFNILEQILMIIGKPNADIELLNTPCSCEKRILFTSLFSWNELGLISKQREAIHALHGKTLRIANSCHTLNLHYYNIPLSNWNRLPTPSETGAVMADYNDETLAHLTLYTFQNLNLPTHDLQAITLKLQCRDSDYLKKQKSIIEGVDAFRHLKPWLASSLMQVLGHVEIVTTLLTLITKKRPDGKPLKGIDELLYLDLLSTQLKLNHSKNCQNATHRSAGAKAADKAQAAFQKICHSPFLPGKHDEKQMSLFQSLYTTYLLWEEPEVNALLNTGTSLNFHNFLNKNPETKKYTLVN